MGAQITPGQLDGMRKSYCPVPVGFIQACCDELEKPVEAVMGVEWLRRYGASAGKLRVPPTGFEPVISTLKG